MSTISSLEIVRPLAFTNSWISWTCCTNYWNGLFASHGSDNFEQFPTRSWFSTCLYSVKRCATLSLTRRWTNPILRSNTKARNVFITDSAICFFPARSRLTHYLNSISASAWSRSRFTKVTLFVPDGMMSWPGWCGTTNKVPSAMITYTASGCRPPRQPYVPPPLLDGIEE